MMLLFLGEVICSSDNHSGKDTIWSLNCRTVLLWHSCLRMRRDPSVSEADLARLGLDAWLEADVLEKALDSHRCGPERTFLFRGREHSSKRVVLHGESHSTTCSVRLILAHCRLLLGRCASLFHWLKARFSHF